MENMVLPPELVGAVGEGEESLLNVLANLGGML
jgi:hypothetical protein